MAKKEKAKMTQGELANLVQGSEKPKVEKAVKGLEYIQGEINLKPSVTVPDKTLSVAQMIARHAKGLPVTGAKIPMWNAELNTPLPDLSNMDPVDRQATLEFYANVFADVKTQIAAKVAANKSQEEAEAYQANFDKALKAKLVELGYDASKTVTDTK